MAVRLRVLEWLVFSVVVGCVPIIGNVISSAVKGNADWPMFFAHGDLLLVSAVLCGTALGRLFMAKLHDLVERMVVGGGCLITFFLAGWEYVALCTPPAQENARSIATLVAIVFVLAVTASSFTVAHSERGN